MLECGEIVHGFYGEASGTTGKPFKSKSTT